MSPKRHKIDPLRFSSTPAEAMNRLKMILQGMERTTVVRETPGYLHVEFRTFLGFVDDVEFYAEEVKRLSICAPLRGWAWDLGVNRRRIESIRIEIEEK